MTHFDFERQRREMLRAMWNAVPPETLMAIRDKMMELALQGNVGAAKVLLQYFPRSLEPQPRTEKEHQPRLGPDYDR